MEEGKRRVNEEEKQVVENAIYDDRRLKKKRERRKNIMLRFNLFPKFPSIGDLLAEPNSINRKLIKLIPL